MEVLLRAKLQKPENCDNKEFFGIWRQEAEAALAAVEAGHIKSIWKVAGKYEVMAVVDVPSGDDMDAIIHSLPIWRLGYAHIVPELEWIPLRPYANWAEQLKELAKG